MPGIDNLAAIRRRISAGCRRQPMMEDRPRQASMQHSALKMDNSPF